MALDWDLLRVALAIGRTGSLAGAAALLEIDQSTVSRKLMRLEEQLEATLFVRSPGGLSPSEAGQNVVAKAAEIERQVNALDDSLTTDARAAAGLVRVLGNGWVLNLLARHVFPRLLHANPQVNLRLIHLLPKAQARGEATVSLWFEAEPRTGEFKIPLGEVDYGVFIPRDRENDEELPWLSFYDEDSPQRAPVHHLMAAVKPGQKNLHMSSTDARDLLAGVEQGVGRAILPICLAELSDRVRRKEPGRAVFRRPMFLHLHPDTVQTRRVQVVSQEIRSRFAAVFSRP